MRALERARALAARLPARWRKALLLWAGIVLAIQAIAYFAFFQDQLDYIELNQAATQKFKDEYVAKKMQAINLDLHRAQLREIEITLAPMLRALPSKFDRGFVNLMLAARRRGLRIDELQPDAEERQRDFYAELRARLKVSGPFHDLGAFAGDVAGIPGTVLLQDLKIDPSATPGVLTMDATLRTFRYLDEDEVATQRKAAAKGRAKK